VQRKGLTTFIYLSAAAGNSAFWLSRNTQGGTWQAALLYWLLFFVAPLLFVFAYPRFLFAPSALQTTRQRSAYILHGLGAAVSTLLFVILGSAFWKNPLRDAGSLALLMIPLVAVPVFLVAALSLLLRNRSTLAKVASFLFWPYWLVLALVFLGRFFEATAFRTVFCFFCFIAPILFSFAAGAISFRSTLAHACALAAMIGLPWIYWTTLKGTELANDWIMFNVPDRELLMYNAPSIAALTIFSVSLVVLAIATAALRLLPTRWMVRGLPFCERTWPAFAAAVLFLAVWFDQSVMPYRIPGAVDYADWPILQILHVEKHGLRFHETCTSVSKRYGFRVSVSENHRRLFQYRFQEEHSEGNLPQPLMQRVQMMIQSPEYAKRQRGTITPVRAWNADNWYFRVEGSPILTYTSEKASTLPPEIVGLFHDLEEAPRSSVTQTDLKDVCLGF